MAAAAMVAARSARRGSSFDVLRSGSIRSARGEPPDLPSSHRTNCEKVQNDGKRVRRGSVESVGDFGSMEMLLTQHDLPTQHVRRKKTLSKLCAGELWAARHVVLTDEKLVCAREGTSQVIDDIPLC